MALLSGEVETHPTPSSQSAVALLPFRMALLSGEVETKIGTFAYHEPKPAEVPDGFAIRGS